MRVFKKMRLSEAGLGDVGPIFDLSIEGGQRWLDRHYQFYRPRRAGRHWSAFDEPRENPQHWLGIEPGTSQY